MLLRRAIIIPSSFFSYFVFAAAAASFLANCFPFNDQDDVGVYNSSGGGSMSTHSNASVAKTLPLHSKQHEANSAEDASAVAMKQLQKQVSHENGGGGGRGENLRMSLEVP